MEFTHLEAVIGPSIGGLMALEFCTLYPDFVNKLISISSGYKLSTLQLLHNLEQGYILDLARIQEIVRMNIYLLQE